MEWEEEEEEQLIHAVAQHQWLYNQQHKYFKNISKKQNSWKAIAAAVKPGFTEDAVKSRWDCLRDKYRRIRNPPEGAGPHWRAHNWPLYPLLDELLHAHTRIRRRRKNRHLPNSHGDISAGAAIGESASAPSFNMRSGVRDLFPVARGSSSSEPINGDVRGATMNGSGGVILNGESNGVAVTRESGRVFTADRNGCVTVYGVSSGVIVDAVSSGTATMAVENGGVALSVEEGRVTPADEGGDVHRDDESGSASPADGSGCDTEASVNGDMEAPYSDLDGEGQASSSGTQDALFPVSDIDREPANLVDPLSSVVEDKRKTHPPRARSPQTRSRSHRNRSRSPQTCSRLPQTRMRPRRTRSRSPQARSSSPQPGSRSAAKRTPPRRQRNRSRTEQGPAPWQQEALNYIRGKREDQFDLFGRQVASLLRRLSKKKSYALMMELLQLMMRGDTE